MALDADKRIADTTLPANGFKDGDILYGSDMNRVTDTLKTAINENYADLKNMAQGKGNAVTQPNGDMPYMRLDENGIPQVSKDKEFWEYLGAMGVLNEYDELMYRRGLVKFEGAKVVDGGDRILISGFQGKQGNDGPEGPQGVQGPQGNDGGSAVIPEGCLYTLYVKPNGDLMLVWSDGDTSPQQFRLDEEGNLYALIGTGIADGDGVRY